MTDQNGDSYTPEQEKLVALFLAGEKNEQDLIAACDDDPNLLALLCEHTEINRLLSFQRYALNSETFVDQVQQQLLSTQSSAIARNKTSSRKRNLLQVFAACACILVAVLVFLPLSNNQHKVGQISRIASASSTGALLNEGQSVYTGKFSLNLGYAEITLDSGVMLILEAPVELSFFSDQHIVLSHGNLVARVPPQAVGFKVDTPSSNIVDLGTEFGVRVDKKGESQVHVIEGEVKVKATEASDYVHLVEDEARSFDLKQQIATIKSEPRRFMRSLPGKSSLAPGYIHWNMDDITDGAITCSGPGISSKCYPAHFRTLDAQKDPQQKTEGKFGRAVYFDGESNWLETEFPGIGGNQPRTIAFWVKVPEDFSVNEGFGIVSWGLSSKRSAWQISINPLDVSGPLGRVRIGTNQGEIVGSTDLRDNQWHHVAIVLFGGQEADLSTHALIYVDGNLENTLGKSIAKVWTELNHPDSQPVNLGKNLAFSDLESEKEDRFFRGTIDEVYLFDAALDQAQIHALVRDNQLPDQN